MNTFWKGNSISFEFTCLVLNKQLWYGAKSVILTTKGSMLMNYVCYLHFLPADNWQVSWHLLLTSCNYMPYIKHQLVCNGPPHTRIHTKWFYVLFKAYSIFKFCVSLTLFCKLLCHSAHVNNVNKISSVLVCQSHSFNWWLHSLVCFVFIKIS